MLPAQEQCLTIHIRLSLSPLWTRQPIASLYTLLIHLLAMAVLVCSFSNYALALMYRVPCLAFALVTFFRVLIDHFPFWYICTSSLGHLRLLWMLDVESRRVWLPLPMHHAQVSKEVFVLSSLRSSAIQSKICKCRHGFSNQHSNLHMLLNYHSVKK